MTNFNELNNALGNTDLYLIDQILKGRFDSSMKILDAGAGEGRNLHYFLKNNFDVHAIDNNAAAIRMLKYIASSLNRTANLDNFQHASLSILPYHDNSFDLVICSAVLHFAKDKQEFSVWVQELCRVCKSKGIVFIRMGSTEGLTEKAPEDDFSFHISEAILSEVLSSNPLKLLEPSKHVLVSGRRCMATLIFEKI